MNEQPVLSSKLWESWQLTELPLRSCISYKDWMISWQPCIFAFI
jgi:hypothetical protein